MKTNHNKNHFLFPSVVGLLLIAGLVHARALESDVYLRPDISPYFSVTDQNVVVQEAKLMTNVTITDKDNDDLVEVTVASTALPETSRFLSFFTNLFSSRIDELNEEQRNSVLARLMIKLGVDNKYVIQANDLTTPTMISNIKVKAPSSSSVTLLWELNKFADVTIYYSTSEKVIATPATSSVKISAFRFANEVTILNLEPGTLYNYLLVVDNHFSKETITSTGSFRTASK